MRNAGIGLVVAGIGCFCGLLGGLSSSIGIGGAIGPAIGASMGLILGSMGPFQESKKILSIDREIARGNVDLEAMNQ